VSRKRGMRFEAPSPGERRASLSETVPPRAVRGRVPGAGGAGFRCLVGRVGWERPAWCEAAVAIARRRKGTGKAVCGALRRRAC